MGEGPAAMKTRETEGMRSIAGVSVRSRDLVVALLLISSVVLATRLARQPLSDWDEAVYLHLSHRMTWHLTDYSTRGSFIDENLPQAVYSSPIFLHPPLIPYAIKLLSPFGVVAGARMLNFLLYALSFFLVYSITARLSDSRGALLATSLWMLCPILNVEARVVHLDFPCSVLLLAGIWFYLKSDEGASGGRTLACSGTCFALAMLTKYSSPLYVCVPVLLFLSSRARVRDLQSWLIFGGTLAGGFAWWVFLLVAFGSLTPPELDQSLDHAISPYLQTLAEREWYHLWIYFLAMCPLFAIYVTGLAGRLWEQLGHPSTHHEFPRERRILLAANLGTLAVVVLFGIINEMRGAYWAFRHIMPTFPIIYISIGCFVTTMLARCNRVSKALLVALTVLTLVTMSASTYATGQKITNLKPIPQPLLWLGFDSLFH